MIYTPIPYSSSAMLVQTPATQGKNSLHFLHPNLNAPLHTLTIVPFALLPIRAAFWVWFLFSLGVGIIAVYLLVKYLDPAEWQFEVLLTTWIVLLAYFPSLINAFLGQYGFIVLLFTVLLWFYGRKGKVLSAGITLGLAIALKAFFGMFLIFFAARRQWRIALAAIFTYITANLIGLVLFGMENYHQYIAQHVLTPLYVNASWNASIMGYFSRIFGIAPNVPMFSAPRVGYGIVYGLSLLLTTAVVWLSWQRKNEDSICRFDLGFSLSAVAMLLISPYAWIYYFPCLIVPLLISWGMAAGQPAKRIYRVSIAAIWILSTWPTFLISPESEKLNSVIIWFTSAGCYYYALQAFFLLLAIMAFQFHRGSEGFKLAS